MKQLLLSFSFILVCALSSAQYNINNKTGDKRISVVIELALKELGVEKAVIEVDYMNNKQKSQFLRMVGSDVNASISNANLVFTLLVSKNLSRSELIESVCHEMVHLKQYSSLDLAVINSRSVIWKGKVFELTKDYDSRPWENEAYNVERELFLKVSNSQYLKR